MVHQTVSESTQNADDMTDTHDIKSSQEPLHLESSRQNKCDIKSFLKRNAFILLTIGAIATGKSKRSLCVHTHIYIYIYVYDVCSHAFYMSEKPWWNQCFFTISVNVFAAAAAHLSFIQATLRLSGGKNKILFCFTKKHMHCQNKYMNKFFVLMFIPFKPL